MNKTEISRLLLLILAGVSIGSYAYLGIGIIFLVLYFITGVWLGVLITTEIVTRYIAKALGTNLQEAAQSLTSDPEAINKLMADLTAEIKKDHMEEAKEKEPEVEESNASS